MLLRIDVPPIDADRRYFDLTTPVLVRLVAPRVTASTRLLDMGTGAFAAIGLALWRRTGCQVVASDEATPQGLRAIAVNVQTQGGQSTARTAGVFALHWPYACPAEHLGGALLSY